MPWQLIFTSAPRGLTPGQSGYCTVARSRDLREALIPRLEKFSYYTPEANRNPVICAHRIVELRGVRYHVLSRIVDAGLDFTKRRKFIAHHLVLEPAELDAAGSPATIFLKWKGWLEHWEGDPQWLDPGAAMPETPTAKHLRAVDAWITGDQWERESFLHSLEGCAWDLTFTNCFQPGDEPADFRFKAVWPKTIGFELAAKAGADLVKLSALQEEPETSPVTPAPIPTQVVKPIAAPIERERKRPLFWPWLAGAATVVALGAAIYFRDRPQILVKTPEPMIVRDAAPREVRPVANADLLFSGAPTWLALAESGELGPAPELDRLFLSLRDAELFGKDIKAGVMLVSSGTKIDANVDAQPRDGKIIFKTARGRIEMSSGNGAVRVDSDFEEGLVLEIISRGRIVIVPKGAPLNLPSAKLIVDDKAQMVSIEPRLEDLLRKVVLPKNTQLALRPRNVPLEAQESAFGLSAATAFDLGAIHKQAKQVVHEKAKSVEALRRELQTLKAEDKKLVTTAKTPAEVKLNERLATLRAEQPKAAAELRALREAAAGIPESLAKIDGFSLFLLQGNVNTEIARFEEDSKLARSASP